MKKQLWKMPINIKGYDVERISIPKGYLLGQKIQLPHSYFIEDEITCTDANNKPLVVSSTASGDILIGGVDKEISEIVGKTIYTFVTLNSKKALNKPLNLGIRFIGDIIDPEDIGQKVNPSADVVHRSMDTFESSSAFNKVGYLDVLYGVKLPDGGEFSEEKNRFNNPILGVKDTEISQDGISFNSVGFNLKGKKSSLAFNGKGIEIVFNAPKNKENPNNTIQLSSVNPSKAIHTGLPIYNKNNPALFHFEEWLTVDTKSKTLNVPNISAQSITARSLKIGDFNITLDSDDNLSIDDVVKIDKNSKKLSIGSLIFNKELIRLIEHLQSQKLSKE